MKKQNVRLVPIAVFIILSLAITAGVITTAINHRLNSSQSRSKENAAVIARRNILQGEVALCAELVPLAMEVNKIAAIDKTVLLASAKSVPEARMFLTGQANQLMRLPLPNCNAREKLLKELLKQNGQP